MAATGDHPETLYYYTNANGLQGILDPPSWPYGTLSKPDDIAPAFDDTWYTYGMAAHLMASDVRYMNDTTELLFGARVVRDRLSQAAADPDTDTELREAFRRIAALLADENNVHQWPWRCFAACFCADEGDLLSQWRGYGGGMGGFAIGFSPQALKLRSYAVELASNGMAMPLTSHCSLYRVGYGIDEANVRADKLVRGLLSSWRGSAPHTSFPMIAGTDGIPTESVGIYALYVAATIKDDAFREEREWRLISASESQYATRTRPTARGLVPYKDFLINARLSPQSNDWSEPESPAITALRT